MSDNQVNTQTNTGTSTVWQIVGRLVTAAIVLAITAFFTPGFTINNFWALAAATIVLTVIDFLIAKDKITSKHNVSPIEVKSGKNYTYTSLNKFKAKYSFKSWLYTIGRNVAIDYLRHNAKQSNTSFDDFEDYIQDEFDLEKIYIIEERKIAVHRALKKLNAEYRQVLWLLYFDGMTNSDAAIVMKKNTRQMKNLVYRAKSALKSELDKEGFVYEEL